MTTFEVWAPDASRVRLRIETEQRDHHEMVAVEDGWWRLELPEADGPVDYTFLLGDDAMPLPDPRSNWQPDGVHGPSRLYDHATFRWTDDQWTGRALPGALLYELHIGTFTEAGTFDAAIDRLNHLAELGVDLVEVMPVNAFNGVHNWGYDGVGWYAVHEEYGGPDGFKRFVDACHRRGLGVVLDVVHNHLGPSGAYLPRFGPYLSHGRNPWGQTINLDGPGSDEVRSYIIDSVLMWFRDYHLDGVRLDAVHALVDHRAVHLLEEMAREVEVLSTHLRRPLSLIAESDLNDTRLVTAREAGGYGLDAVWDDDVHHAVHTLITGERQGYYGDFGSLECLSTVLTSAYYHANTWSTFRGRVHGRPVDRANIPGSRFVVSLQNHDQIGNRATGDRLSATLPPGMLKIGAALILTSPFTPMLFMGEEWGASTPWQFFTSHPEPELGAATANGRISEFAEHGWSRAEVPDPQDPATFARSKLDWSELDGEPHKDILDFYRRLIALRRSHTDLTDPRLDESRVSFSEAEHWLVARRGRFAVAVNLADERQSVPLERAPIDVLLASERWVVLASHAVELPPQSVAILDLG